MIILGKLYIFIYCVCIYVNISWQLNDDWYGMILENIYLIFIAKLLTKKIPQNFQFIE